MASQPGLSALQPRKEVPGLAEKSTLIHALILGLLSHSLKAREHVTVLLGRRHFRDQGEQGSPRLKVKEQHWNRKVTGAGGTKAEQRGWIWPHEAAWVRLEVELCPPQCPGGYLQPVSAQGQPQDSCLTPSAVSAPEIPLHLCPCFDHLLL